MTLKQRLWYTGAFRSHMARLPPERKGRCDGREGLALRRRLVQRHVAPERRRRKEDKCATELFRFLTWFCHPLQWLSIPHHASLLSVPQTSNAYHRTS